MKEYRRVSLANLRRRLKIEEYERDTPCESVEFHPALVRVKMRQHAGQPAVPAVRAGQRVKEGQAIGRIEEGKLGANVHAQSPARSAP